MMLWQRAGAVRVGKEFPTVLVGTGVRHSLMDTWGQNREHLEDNPRDIASKGRNP